MPKTFHTTTTQQLAALRLGQLLLHKGIITGQQLNRALNYQQHHGALLGEALITLGFISRAILRRTLHRQAWLKSWTVCVMTLGSLSNAWAQDKQTEFSSDWIEFNQWAHIQPETLNRQSKTTDVLSLLAAFSWKIYEGAPKKGEMSFSVKKPEDDSVALHLMVRF